MLIFDVTDYGDGTGAMVTLQACQGLGDSYWGIVCAGKVLTVVWLPEGITIETSIVYDQSLLSQAAALGLAAEFPVSIVPNSGYSDSSVADLTIQQQDFLLDKARTVQIDFDCVIEVLSAFGDSNQFSAWTLSGLQRYINGQPTANRTQLQMSILLLTSSAALPVTTNGQDVTTGVANTGSGSLNVTTGQAVSAHYVYLQIGSLILASGSITGNGTVTLAAQNGSGLNGTVVLNYSADITEIGAAFIDARWAEKYNINIASVLNFPRTPELVVADPGLSNRLNGKVGPLTAGTYPFVVQAVTDTGIKGNNIAAQGTIAVPGRPLPPGVPALDSPTGDYTDTKIVATASLTAGATYIWHDMQYINGPIDFHASAATFPAVTAGSTMHLTLPTLPGGAQAGIRRGALVAVNGGIEDGYRKPFEVEYLANGTIYAPRPNVPSFNVDSKTGRQLTVRFAYDSANQAGIGAIAELFIVEKGGVVNWNAPAAVVSLGGITGTIKNGTISAVAPADDWYQYAVVIQTAVPITTNGTNVTTNSQNVTTGGVQSINSQPFVAIFTNGQNVTTNNTDVLTQGPASLQGPEWLSNAIPAAPGNVAATLIG